MGEAHFCPAANFHERIFCVGHSERVNCFICSSVILEYIMNGIKYIIIVDHVIQFISRMYRQKQY
jgi:hypothetical protein